MTLFLLLWELQSFLMSLHDLNMLKLSYVMIILLINVAKCIDKYTELRNLPNANIDPRLQSVFERMVQRCFNDKQFQQAIGVGIEAKRLDVVEQALQLAGFTEDILNYTKTSAMTSIQTLEFRNVVLELLVKVYNSLKVPDLLAVCQIHIFLNNPAECVKILSSLIEKKSTVLSFQIAFDLYDNARQEFLLKCINVLKGLPDSDHKTKIISILSGDVTIKLYLEFLYRNNNTDKLILSASKDSLDARSSVYHSGLTIANAFMNAGTTNDQFLRDNMDWLGKANNWTKFTATATLGAIHKGQLAQGLSLLKPYLPQPGVTGSPYSEGGALMALGLIHANHGIGSIDYLLQALKATQSEVVQHGTCLGLGLSAMASDNNQIYEELKAILYTDSAVAGEAAGLAMGLVKLGTGNATAIDEMLQYAHDTQHEKIIRGLAMGLSFIMFGLEDKADALIEQLTRDKDPILRYGGIYTIAMAYAGTGNNKAIRKLLHVAVSDTSDDVRRASGKEIDFC
jgi:26S proteasome regulatory subunit N2